jgi:hypothetical protein
MSLAVNVALFLCTNFAHAYGLVENRLFREAGEFFPGHHFRLYHGWLAFLAAANAVVVYGLSGNLWLALLVLVYFPFGLDWVWWVKRWFDFQVRLVLYGVTVFIGPDDAAKFYGETNAWLSREDWDNYLGLPLFLDVYWWWWVLGGASAVLGVLAVWPG